MSETYASGSQEQTAAGGLMILVASFLAAVLVIAGLVYAAGTGARHQAALAAAGCEPNLSHSGLQCTTVWMLERRYLAITTPATQLLNADVAAYTASERHSLAAAKAALAAELTSANAFGESLARFPFPPAIAPQAKALSQAIRARVTLTAEQARSSSLAQLRSFNSRVQIASAAVRTEMKLVRMALDTRPTADQEPS
jgi:hypothetical protein